MTAIYNHAVAHTTGTFDTEPKTLDGAWLERHEKRHPAVVAVEGGRVLGWATLSPWSDRCAYARSVEVSIYVDDAAKGRGLGGILLDELIVRGRALGHKQLLARISADNAASLRMHERRGFARAGLLKRVGEKFGRVLDVAILQKPLEDA